MPYYAQINSENKVIQVLNVETKPTDGVWIETSFDTRYGQNLKGETPLRKNFAAVGFSYDPIRDAFISTKQFDSWILNEDSCTWEPPIPYPIDGSNYRWDESEIKWRILV